MRSIVAPAVTAVVLLAAASPHAGGQVPAGGEFIVNTSTANDQVASAIGRDDRGNFVIVWDNRGHYEVYNDIRGQRYDRAGAPVGAEFVVSTGGATGPSVTMTPAGDFVVVWTQYRGSDSDVFAQRYNGNGSLRGAEFRVNAYTTGSQQRGQAAIDGRGNLVITYGGPGGILARRFDANNAPLGSEFQVNTNTGLFIYLDGLAADAAGNFVIAWTEGCLLVGCSNPPPNAAARIFDPNGNPVGPQFQIATPRAILPAPMYAPDGTILVVFRQSGVAARRFSGTGTPLGSQFQVNTYTTGSPSFPSVDRDSVGNYVVQWMDFLGDGSGRAVKARRYTAADVARSGEFLVNTYTTGNQTAYRHAVASDRVGNFAITWWSPQDGDRNGIVAQRYGGIHPQALGVDTAGNRVLEPGETVDVVPTWFNANGLAQALGGALSNITGPPGAAYAITDASADYGTIANNTAAPCTSDCYGVSVSNPPTRPAVHWDASADETLTPDTQGQAIRRSLHVGASFTDVPTANPFYRFIETLLHHGVTGGCSPTEYCPAKSTTRAQMAVFVLVAKEGTGYVPPACTTPMFPDVPASSPFCGWIEELARRAVVSGCGGGKYCPASPVTREQMAVFVLRTLDPALNPPACTTPLYNDVPASSPFCRWIEELANRAVVTGCGGGNYCPLAPVTRDQMGVFISVTFGLTLYGP